MNPGLHLLMRFALPIESHKQRSLWDLVFEANLINKVCSPEV